MLYTWIYPELFVVTEYIQSKNTENSGKLTESNLGSARDVSDTEAN